MWKYFLLSCAVLGYAFYDASGGADFVPESPETHRMANVRDAGLPAPEPVITVVSYRPAGGAKPIEAPAEEAEVTRASVNLAELDKSAPAAAQILDAAKGPALEQAVKAVAAPAAPEPAPQPAADLRVVTGDVVNMRSGPGTTHGVVAKLSRGTQVEVTGQSGGWLELFVPSTGDTGYMADWLVSAAG